MSKPMTEKRLQQIERGVELMINGPKTFQTMIKRNGKLVPLNEPPSATAILTQELVDEIRRLRAKLKQLGKH